MTADKFSILLDSLGACLEAKKWATGKDLKTVWETCERGDWLLWLCGRMVGAEGWPTRQEVVLAACDCSETALRYVEPGETRPAECIRVVRAWAEGKATIKQVREARSATAANAADAANAAAEAAYAAVYTAAAAYIAAKAATAAAYAAAYAADAADAAAYVAYYAAATDIAAHYAAAEAADAARKKALKHCADLVRARITNGAMHG